MVKSNYLHFYKFWRLVILPLFLTNLPKPATAQLTPDQTLGNESSFVTPNVTVRGKSADLIEGGAIRGGNLFHSFENFNIAVPERIYFANPNGIANILTRITGRNSSQILGTLGVDGNANLFLINPKGIYFGEKAALDVNGSFLATTADAIKLGEDKLFSATEPQNSQLVSVQPGALFINGIRKNQAIINNQANLIIGTDLTLSADRVISTGNLTSTAGKVTVEAVGGNANLSNITAKKDVDITANGSIFINGAKINTQSLGNANSGNVSIRANENITFENSTIDTSTLDFVNRVLGSGNSGTVLVNANETVNIKNSSIDTSTAMSGEGGNITIDGKVINILGGNITSQTWNFLRNPNSLEIGGDGGNIYIGIHTNNNKITISDATTIFTDTHGFHGNNINFSRDIPGNAGNIFIGNINSQSVLISSGSIVNAQSHSHRPADYSSGETGSITIQGQKVNIAGSETLISATAFGMAKGGNITINGTEFIGIQDQAKIIAETSGAANTALGGNISIGHDISSNQITINNANISVTTGLTQAHAHGFDPELGHADAGNIFIGNATSKIDITNNSLISANTTTDGGAAGNIIITAKEFYLNNGSNIQTDTFNYGSAGDIYLNVSNIINIDGGSLESTTSPDSYGKGGNININAANTYLRNGSKVAASSQGLGKGGDITINSNSLLMDQNALISAETFSSNGGNITLNINDLLLLRHNSKITATAGQSGAGGDGGNIEINSPLIVAIEDEDSDITANAFEGAGGNIQINTQGIFGIQFREALTPKSDITASSQLGISGLVQVNTLGFDVKNNLTSLTSNLVNVEQAIANSCLAQRNVTQGSLVNTGTGGLPSNPYNVSDRYSLSTIKPITTNAAKSATQPSIPTLPSTTSVAEAQGLIITSDGRFLLEATPSKINPAKDLACSNS